MNNHDNVICVLDVEQVLARINLANTALDWQWKFHVRPVAPTAGTSNGFLIHASFMRPDTNTGLLGEGRSRDEYVAFGAHPDSVIKTAYVILDLTVKHELMEAFHVDGARVFDPHRPIGELVAAGGGFDRDLFHMMSQLLNVKSDLEVRADGVAIITVRGHRSIEWRDGRFRVGDATWPGDVVGLKDALANAARLGEPPVPAESLAS